MKLQQNKSILSSSSTVKSSQQISYKSILQNYKNKITQVKSIKEEEPLQGKFETTQLATEEQKKSAKPNNTGLPDNLKSGIENMSGYSMDDVKVHYNSSQPATLQAHAYAQGTDIHIAPGQEKHLPHEAWHVVQQKQGRVKPTMQMKGSVPVNDDAGLEKEADIMGSKATKNSRIIYQLHSNVIQNSGVAQLAPMPSMGLPDTGNLYNAEENSKNKVFDGKKPQFGKNLYASVLNHFSGTDDFGRTYIKFKGGYQYVPNEFVQLDHDPSWRSRLDDMNNFPIDKNHQEMNEWVEKKYYKKLNNERYLPTIYAARMYYNDFGSLIPSSGGLNASGGANSAGQVGNEGSFVEELNKEFILNLYGAVSSAFVDGVNLEDGGQVEMILMNIKTTIDKLESMKNTILAMYSKPSTSSMMLDE